MTRLAPLPPDPSAPKLLVDLYSDTHTKPTRAMREAMLVAEVGDEQHGDDPTVNALCARMADLLGKQAAMFLPSGTMCNEVAILTHCRPGDEILAHPTAHIIAAEAGAPWALAGVQVTGIDGPRGQFDVASLDAAIRQPRRHAPPQTLMAVEQTSNLGGGAIWPPERLRAVAEAAHAHGLATHMDGARLFNATVALGVAPREMAEGYDSVWVDFTKGLGAPLGAALAGSEAFIDAAWRWKQRLGGAMRQAGICAAACLYALDHHVDRLAEDHDNARALADGLGRIAGIAAERPDTNLVFFDTSGTGLEAQELAARVRRRGVQISVMGRHRARACLHLGVTRADVETALAAIRAAAEG